MSGNSSKESAQYVKKYRQKKKWHKVVTSLSAVVVFITTYILILPAITLETKTYCGHVEHLHGEDADCYEERLICGYPEVPEETLPIYEERQVLVCNLPEGELPDAMALEEETEEETRKAEHEHTDECYEMKRVLVCGQSEQNTYADPDLVYDEDLPMDDFILDDADIEEGWGDALDDGSQAGETGHIHDDSCYEMRRVLTCDQGEEEGLISFEEEPQQDDEEEVHYHDSSCYVTERVLVSEGEPAHVHDASCYEQVLICDKEEHLHDDACYIDPNAEEERQEETESSAIEGEVKDNAEEETVEADVRVIAETEAAETLAAEESETAEMLAVEETEISETQAIEETEKADESVAETAGEEETETEPANESVAEEETETATETEPATEAAAESVTEEETEAEEIGYESVFEAVDYEYDLEEMTEEMTEEETEVMEPVDQELIYEGEDYSIRAHIPAEAAFPADVRLEVEELTGDKYEETLEAAKTAAELEEVSFARFFDITFYSGEEKLEPKAPIQIEITYTEQVLEEVETEDLMPEEAEEIDQETEQDEEENYVDTVVHFADAGTEVLDTQKEINEEGNTVYTFVQESFSVT